ncbi:DUF3450 domain-containing protein [Alkalimarinus alittae]|uniref:DUF3450 domain-containing protein n=1 Tax=Alkalimarinus alittae TaxID=2961619 RepID=A0ABY6N4W0_9ALTE|nr:DUF3450 domain-containing protein [Alkalimarinus alittae]UZE97075.1 DUF3450 domain-containing protein [Alkalimarinus alittae]
MNFILKPPLFAAGLILGSNIAIASALVEKTQIQINKATLKAAHSQQQINNLDEQTTESYYLYLEAMGRAKQIEAYNEQLRRLVSSQELELKDLAKQISSLEETDQAVLPLLANMQKMLGKFIVSDLPFLEEERSTRLARLQTLLNRADVSIAEKYRQILEAYQIEVEYGRTLEAYNAPLSTNGITRDVTFLKLGRVALYYQTADGKESGVWDNIEKDWKQLDSSYRWPIHKGIQLAMQQTVPELLNLPLTTVEMP